MKTLWVPLVAALNSMPVSEISTFLDTHLVFEYIDMLNWPQQFPYKPECKFKIARTEKYLYIKYYVKEKHLRAVATKDQDPVWEDSCVEFFCQIPGQKAYHNFEFNCTGKCLATTRISKTEHIHPYTPEQLCRIKRLPSLGKLPFSEKTGFFEWTLTVGIPMELINPNNQPLTSLRANFYKCGDKTSEPHYLSWSLIVAEQPNFHLPEYFGTLNF